MSDEQTARVHDCPSCQCEPPALHETAALQWALVALRSAIFVDPFGTPNARWFRESIPTIGRLLSEAIARDRSDGATR